MEGNIEVGVWDVGFWGSDEGEVLFEEISFGGIGGSEVRARTVSAATMPLRSFVRFEERDVKIEIFGLGNRE